MLYYRKMGQTYTLDRSDIDTISDMVDSVIQTDDDFVKSQTYPLTVIPAPHQVRDKLQPESSLPVRDRTQTGNYKQL